MKLFTNLPGNLRRLFGFLRGLAAAMTIFWLLLFTFDTWIQKFFTDEPRVIVAVGEISLPAMPAAFGLSSDTAKPGALALQSLRGRLQMDLASKDAALVSALRWTLFPSLLALLVFPWLLFGALRDLCANIERGEVFSEKNPRLVRRIGVTLIVYSLVAFALEIWASHVLGGYFHQHVVLTGFATSVPFSGGPVALGFEQARGFLTTQGGLVTGCLVLMVAEAFRQGLKLKTENDLTV